MWFSGRSPEQTNELNTISGDNGKRDPPVPIPNTEVKPLRADGTWLATARESRSSPDSKEPVMCAAGSNFIAEFAEAIHLVRSSQALYVSLMRAEMGLKGKCFVVVHGW